MVCSYALGVLDKRTGVMRLAPVAGAGLVRLEPRVRGYSYGPTASAQPAQALDRAGRINQNRQCAPLPELAQRSIQLWPVHQCADCPGPLTVRRN